MKMKFILLREEDISWIKKNIKNGLKPNIISFYAADNQISAAKVLWKAEKSGTAAGFNIVPISFKNNVSFPLTWAGRDEILVPPAQLDFHCSPTVSYRQALCNRMMEAADIIFKEKQKEALLSEPYLLLFAFPERQQWEEGGKHLVELLQEVFSPFCLCRVIVVKYSQGAALKMPAVQTLLSVRTGESWTEMAVRLPDGQTVHESAAALKMPENKDLRQTPIRIRINDYIHNSCSIWTEMESPSWADAFFKVCRDFKDAGWPVCRQINVICKREYYSAVRDGLQKSGLAGEKKGSRIDYDQLPACTVAQAWAAEIERLRFPQEKTDAGMIKRKRPQQKKTEFEKKDSIFDL